MESTEPADPKSEQTRSAADSPNGDQSTKKPDKLVDTGDITLKNNDVDVSKIKKEALNKKLFNYISGIAAILTIIVTFVTYWSDLSNYAIHAAEHVRNFTLSGVYTAENSRKLEKIDERIRLQDSQLSMWWCLGSGGNLKAA